MWVFTVSRTDQSKEPMSVNIENLAQLTSIVSYFRKYYSKDLKRFSFLEI